MATFLLPARASHQCEIRSYDAELLRPARPRPGGRRDGSAVDRFRPLARQCRCIRIPLLLARRRQVAHADPGRRASGRNCDKRGSPLPHPLLYFNTRGHRELDGEVHLGPDSLLAYLPERPQHPSSQRRRRIGHWEMDIMIWYFERHSSIPWFEVSQTSLRLFRRATPGSGAWPPSPLRWRCFTSHPRVDPLSGPSYTPQRTVRS